MDTKKLKEIRRRLNNKAGFARQEDRLPVLLSSKSSHLLRPGGVGVPGLGSHEGCISFFCPRALRAALAPLQPTPAVTGPYQACKLLSGSSSDSGGIRLPRTRVSKGPITTLHLAHY